MSVGSADERYRVDRGGWHGGRQDDVSRRADRRPTRAGIVTKHDALVCGRDSREPAGGTSRATPDDAGRPRVETTWITVAVELDSWPPAIWRPTDRMRAGDRNDNHR